MLIGAIVAESFSFRTAIIESNHVRGKQGWVRFVRTRQGSRSCRSSCWKTSGRFLAWCSRSFGVSMTLVTGNGIWDAAGTGMIGLLLVAIAVVLAVETKSLLLGESASRDDVVRIRTAIEADGTQPIIHLKTLHLGTGGAAGGGEDLVGAPETGQDIAAAIDAAEPGSARPFRSPG